MDSSVSSFCDCNGYFVFATVWTCLARFSYVYQKCIVKKDLVKMVSIIVPVYNAEEYLRQCLDSIQNQTYTDFEVILVDDGSTDCSGAICDEYAQKDKRFRVVHQMNSGVSVARNIGIEISKGQWVTFIDADDYIGNEYLSVLTNAAVDINALVLHGYCKFNSHEFIEAIDFGDLAFTPDTMYLAFGKYRIFEKGFSWGKLYSHEILLKQNIRFNPLISYAEDMIFMLEYIGHIESIIFHVGSNYFYRIGTTTLSQRYNPFESEYLLFNEFKKLNNNIARRFGFILTEEYWQTSATLLIRCIISIYEVDRRMGYSDRIRLLLTLKKHQKLLKKHYHPKAFILKLIRFLFLNNIRFLDLFYRLKTQMK